MNLEHFLENLPDFAVDIKLNAKNLLKEEGGALTVKQVGIIMLACGFASKNKALYEVMLKHFSGKLNEVEINAAKISAVLMSMTNVYYRFTHLVSNHEYSKLPAGLRMNSMAPSKHGIEGIDFELSSLAVSALNGCGMCMDSHEKTLKKHNVTDVNIQEAVKIAAVVNSLSTLV